MTKCINVVGSTLLLAVVCLLRPSLGLAAEITFPQAWSNLSSYMSVCLDQQSPCDLTESERDYLRGLLSLQAKCYPQVAVEHSPSNIFSRGSCGEVLKVNSSRLYENGELIHSRAALMGVALTILEKKSCAANLELTSPLNISSLVQRREHIAYFARHREPGHLFSIQNLKTENDGHRLFVRTGNSWVALNEWLLERLGAQAGSTLEISNLRTQLRLHTLEIQGTLEVSGKRKFGFWLWIGSELDFAKARLIFEPQASNGSRLRFGLEQNRNYA